jgi:hypothetical protein
LVRRYITYHKGPHWRRSEPSWVPQEIRTWVYRTGSIRIPWLVRFFKLGLEATFPLSPIELDQDPH